MPKILVRVMLVEFNCKVIPMHLPLVVNLPQLQLSDHYTAEIIEKDSILSKINSESAEALMTTWAPLVK